MPRLTHTIATSSLLRRKSPIAAVALFGTAALAIAATAAPPQPMTSPEARLDAYETHQEMAAIHPWGEVRWQFLGPTNISGRVTDVAVITPRGEHYTAFAATASGGVWRTINDGVTWEPIFDDAPTTSIGDVTIAPSDQNTIWIGTGEANIFRSSMAGVGVYKSTDGGDTWQHKGLGETHTIPRIVIHPDDANTLYVASSGHEWTDNAQRGVYKSTDGGDTWEKVLFISERTGAVDLVMDPNNPDTLYAATWQRIRRRYHDPRIEAGYNESGIYKTTDGGANWTRLTEGLPTPEVTGRIGLDLCATQPNVVYAFVDNYEIGREAEEGTTDSYGRPVQGTIKGAELYRSDDSGETWAKVSETNNYMMRLSSTYGWVFGQMRVDPNHPDVVYVMGLALNRSDDGGKTFRRIGNMHGDHHALWLDPANSDFLVNSNDGGICFSYDGGENWRIFRDNLPVVQFYNVGFDYAEPFHIYGSIQDHGSMRGTVNMQRGRNRIRPTEWDRAPGGEASTHAADPTDANVLYSAGFYGRMQRTDMAANETTNISPPRADDDPPQRGQWLAPFIISPHDVNTLYHGFQHVSKSTDQGETWQRFSDDLSHDNVDMYGDIPYQTIFAIAESPVTEGVVYAGTDDGRAHVTRDGGDSWVEITGGLADSRWVSRIVASQHDEATVYLSQNGKRWDDFAAYLWKSSDHGETWNDISGNIPFGPINVVREDPHFANILYAGTDVGVYVSFNGGESWRALCNGLPSTFVQDLVVHPRDKVMIAATHGRGMYAIDLEPIYVYATFGGE